MNNEKMSPQAQRIAIAEACGWTDIKTGPYDGLPFGRRKSHQLEVIPDYLDDLNAMHEAEKVLENLQEAAFRGWLWLAHNQPEFRCRIVHATAAQRAEAFLRTIGKWENTAAKEAKP